jgi:hypothetical protein
MSVAITNLAHIFLQKIIFLIISDKLAFLILFLKIVIHVCASLVKVDGQEEACKGEN